MKTLARRLGLRPAARSLSKNASTALFHTLKIFRREIGGRHEVRINGKAGIYDIFACRDNRYIGLVGHYGRLRNPDTLTCVFGSGEVSECIWIDDPHHAHEGEQVLVCLFPVPEIDRRAGLATVSLASPDGNIVSGLTIRFEETPRQYELSVATLIKDEDRFVREWIEYYRVLGAGHFYIYDNRSLKKHKIRKLLKPYLEHGIATLVDWDYPYVVDDASTWRFCQRGQMHHCLYKYGHTSRWMLFIDVDEFVYPVEREQMSLLPLLDTCWQDPAIAALKFKMIWFGNSGFTRVPSGLVIDNYTHRATEVVRTGREKCCVRPDRVELMQIHQVKQCVGGTGMIRVPPEQYRLNHYYATSASRRRGCDDRFNEEEDTGMARFVPLVRRRLHGTE